MEIKTREQVEKEKNNQSSQVRDMFSNAAMTGKQENDEQKSEQTGQENGNQEQEETQGTEAQKQENKEQEEKTESKQTEERKSEEEKQDTKDEVVDKLRRRVAELETGKAFEQPEQEFPDEKKEEGKQARSDEQQIEEMASFITNDEFEEMQSDPQKFNEVLARVYQKARQDTLQDIPEVVERTSARQMSLKDAVSKFYQENPELRNHGQYMAYVVNQVRNNNPDMPVQDILNTAGERVRNDLAISKEAQDTETERRKNESQNNNNEDQPAFPKRGSGSHKGGKQDNRNDFQKQADEMIQTLR